MSVSIFHLKIICISATFMNHCDINVLHALLNCISCIYCINAFNHYRVYLSIKEYSILFYSNRITALGRPESNTGGGGGGGAWGGELNRFYGANLHIHLPPRFTKSNWLFGSHG